MRPLIVFYSLTGSTRHLAERLAAALGGADLEEIGCARYRTGGLGFARAAVEAALGIVPPLERVPGCAGRDLVLIGAPVWAGRAAPPLVAWLARKPSLPARTGVFLSSGAGGDQAAAFDRLIRAMPVAPRARLSLSEAEVKAGGGGDRVDAFLAALGAGPGG